MMTLLAEPPASFVMAIAGILFVACLLTFLVRYTHLARCGVFIAASAVILTGLAVTTLFMPLSLNGTTCGMAAGALGANASTSVCHVVQQTVFESATWLALAGMATAFLSFAPGLRTKPQAVTV
ncbi:hypothetical protein [Glutamicibacter sp.]|uniref:hypothetical protein n=1 Tax=Glutamicibacter sp. TaxID=1931995 RepID=UPI0028BE5AEB|nr:hypothetical protein [Glutamicibacter sp.]